MITIAGLARGAAAISLRLGPDNADSPRDCAYEALKNAIADTNIYDPQQELRLDERELGMALGIGRTPVHEALARLEQEGFVHTLPRRGIYITRKSKREIIELIQMWAALECMAARLAAMRATAADIGMLRRLFDEFAGVSPALHLRAYSDANIAFHSAIVALGGSQTMLDATRNLLFHVRAVRRLTIAQNDRASQSIVDHMQIIDAFERRDAELVEFLTRRHTLKLAAHVERHCDLPT